MSSLVRSWMALGVLAFVANSAVCPAIARAANDAPPVPPPAGAYAPAPPGQPPAPPPAGTVAPYPAPYGTYPPPPGYAPVPQYPGYATYPGYPQPQLTKVHRPRRGLVTAGAITFGVTWGIAASISLLLNDSCSGCSDSSDYLWIPIVGPLVVAARDSSSDGNSFFILWSAAQAAGAAMLVVGLIGRDVMEYRYARSGATLHLTPLIARNASGMALTARW